MHACMHACMQRDREREGLYQCISYMYDMSIYMYENQSTQIAIPQNCPFIHSQDLLALFFCIGCSELVHFIQGSWPTLRWATRSPSWPHCPTQSVPKALHQGHSVPLFPQHFCFHLFSSVFCRPQIVHQIAFANVQNKPGLLPSIVDQSPFMRNQNAAAPRESLKQIPSSFAED